MSFSSWDEGWHFSAQWEQSMLATSTPSAAKNHHGDLTRWTVKEASNSFIFFFFFFSELVVGVQTQTAMQMRFTWMTSNDFRVAALVQAAEKEKPCISTESQHKSKCIFVRLLWSPSYFSCWVIYGGLGHAGQSDGWHVTKGWGRIHTYRAPSTLNISYTQVKHSNALEANK